MNNDDGIRFDGADYQPERDNPRLEPQYNRIWKLMLDESYRTLGEIAHLVGAPEASVSAQLRHMRKPRFGGHTINRRHRGDPANGLYEYQLVVNHEPVFEESDDNEH